MNDYQVEYWVNDVKFTEGSFQAASIQAANDAAKLAAPGLDLPEGWVKLKVYETAYHTKS